MYTGDRLGDRISSPCDHIRHHFLGHSRANDERLLGTINREGPSAGKASLHSGPFPGSTDALCQHFSRVKNLVPPQILPAANIYTQLTTAITWNMWRGTVFPVPVSTLQRPKQMGDTGYSGEVYGTSPMPYVPARPTELNGDCSVVIDMEPHWKAGKPTACHNVPH